MRLQPDRKRLQPARKRPPAKASADFKELLWGRCNTFKTQRASAKASKTRIHWRNPPGRCTSRVNLRHSQSGRCTRGVSLWRMQSGQCTLRASPAIQIRFRRTVAGVYPARPCESEFTVCVIVLPHSSPGVNSFLMEAG